MVCYDNGKESIELLMSSISVENLIMRPRNAIVAVSWRDIFHNKDNQQGEVSETAEGQPRSLLRMRKCAYPGYLQENPFVQNRGNGFFLFNRET